MKINLVPPFINPFLESIDTDPKHINFTTYLIIIVLVAIAYGGSLRNGFIWDDETFIQTNQYVHDISKWKEYFTTPESISSDPILSRMYRPVQTLSFAIDALLWKNNAFGYHLSSLILHCACCIALIFTFRVLMGLKPAIISAFIFAVHPALSEGVLSLAARGNQLYTLFSLLSIGLFLRTIRPFDKNHLVSIIMLSLALFSKEPSIVLIAFLFIIQVFFKQPWKIKSYSSLFLYAPFFLMTVFFLYARSKVVNTASVEPYWGGSLWATMQMQAKVFITYLSLLPWPFNLQGRYTIAPPAPFPDLKIIGAIVLNVALMLSGILLYHKERKGKLFALAVIWFYLSLLPVSNIIPIPGSMMGERFIYFTFAGMIPFLVASVPFPSIKINKVVISVCTVLIVSIWLITDIARTAVWRDNRSFFTLSSRQAPTDGTVQLRIAQEELAAKNISSALTRLEHILQSKPGPSFYQVHYWYAQALLAADRPAEAYREFKITAELLGDTHSDLVVFLAETASRTGAFKEALSLLQKELRKSRENDQIWNALGNVYFMMGNVSAAIPCYENAIRINPDNTEAAANLQTSLRETPHRKIKE
jgi:protein O-mannosyl-transferase